METPLLRVSRPVSACARCRNAKIRCDGKLPACSACERAGKSSECSSVNDVFAKGKERSYVSSLELRIEKLNRQIAQAKAERDGIVSSPLTSPLPPLINGTKRANQNAETSDVDELVSDFGYLVLNATSTGYNGFDKEMSFARLAISSATVEPLPKAQSSDLPPREVTMMLVQDCIKHVFSIYPVLSDTSIFGSVESMYQHNGQFSRPSQIWNVRLVLAIGLLCRSTIKGDTNHQAAAVHVAIALEQAEAVLQPGITTTTQAILLLVLYSMLDSTHFSPWYLLSIAVRVWLDIGLHQESAHMKRPLQVAQSHRRLFYCMYSLDRVIAFSHVRLLSFIDNAIDVKLPVMDTSFNFYDSQLSTEKQRSTEDNFILLVKLRQIESRIYEGIFSSTRERMYEPWFNRSQQIVSLQNSYRELCHHANETQRHVLSLDVHYLIVLVIQPVETQAMSDRYSSHLLFDGVTSYAEALAWLVRQNNPVGCYTNLELPRAKRITRYFTRLLDTQSAWILGGGVLPNEIAANEQQPLLIRRNPQDVSSAISGFCSNMRYALDVLAERFGMQPDHQRLVEELSTRLYILSTQQHQQRHQKNMASNQSFKEQQRYADNLRQGLLESGSSQAS